MITPEISTYVKDQLAKGTPPESLRQSLSASGWSTPDIDTLLSPAGQSPLSSASTTIPAPASSTDHRTLITILLLLFVTPIGIIVMWFWSKWKTWVKIVVTLVTLIPIVLFIVFTMGMGLFVANSAKYMTLPTDSASSSATTAPTGDFFAAYRASFVQSCQAAAGTDAAAQTICTCVADELIAGHTPEELLEISQQYTTTGDLPEEVAETISLCSSPEIAP